ncbi:hypothetical protein IWQ57_001264 [Coemansia nantahalensis]|uniref:Uncharacterized protein n=1 Tax=Coemansia nantahalensis TaxID=2789366 RepID=A0ACC1K501_9FUNG|nr:hypothetical protein IWQ57_001264 [Coemansia nantahalensis]
METAYTILIRDRTDLGIWDLVGRCVEEIRKRGFVPVENPKCVSTIYADRRDVLYGQGVTPYVSDIYTRGQTLVLVKSKYSGGELRFKVTTDQGRLKAYKRYMDGYCVSRKFNDEKEDEKL